MKELGHDPRSRACGDSTAGQGARRPMVVLDGVDKTFSSQAGDTIALQDIDLTVGTGEFVSLIGPSGCGKSTLLRVVG